MSKTRKLVLALVSAVALLAASGTAYAVGANHADPGATGVSTKDYQELSQLYGDYARDVDPGSPQDASWLFTDDGTFTVGALVVHGKAALQAFYQTTRTNQANGTRHYNTSYVFKKVKGGVIGSSYMVFFGRASATAPWTVTGSGVYEDFVVHQKNGWHFKTRIYHQDTFIGDPTPFPVSPIG